MAKMSLSQRFPMSFRVIMLLAVIVAVPLTVWSVQNASTQTQQHAADTAVYDCAYAPTWSSTLEHIDNKTSVRYKLAVYPNTNCKGIHYEMWLKAVVPSGWSYKYEFPNCRQNIECFQYPVSSTPFFVTISRPVSETKGTFSIKLYASHNDSGTPKATKTLTYIVQ